MEEIKYDVEGTRKGKVAYIHVSEIQSDGSSPVPPFSRKTSITFALGNQRGVAVTESELEASLEIINPVLAKEYAVKIIENCDEVAQVLIGRSFSDNNYSYSYMGKARLSKTLVSNLPRSGHGASDGVLDKGWTLRALKSWWRAFIHCLEVPFVFLLLFGECCYFGMTIFSPWLSGLRLEASD